MDANQHFEAVIDVAVNVVLDFIAAPRASQPVLPVVSKSDVLAHLQSVGRTPLQDSINIIQEITVLGKALDQCSSSEGIVRGAIGGLYYQINRLAKNYNVQMTLEELAEQYVTAELGSFCVHAQEVMNAKEWARGRGLNVASTGIACMDGCTRHMLFFRLQSN